MTAHNTPDLPGPWPDVLAAYADGELDPAARAVVCQWVATNPAALNELRVQQLLSPENWPLWQQAEPPLPPEHAWAAVREAIAETALPLSATPAGRPAVRERWAVGRVPRGLAVAVAGIAFAVGGWLLLDRLALAPPPPAHDSLPVVNDDQPGRSTDPLAGFAVLPMAADSDVDIQHVAGGTATYLPVGEPPLSGPLVLAGEEDVELEGADPHPAWPGGSPRMTTTPGDAPMIFAAKPR